MEFKEMEDDEMIDLEELDKSSEEDDDEDFKDNTMNLVENPIIVGDLVYFLFDDGTWRNIELSIYSAAKKCH